MRRWAGPGATLLVTAAVVWPVAPTATAAATQGTVPVGEQPLETAARAAQQVSFEGVVQVRWWEGPTLRVERLDVQGANGSVVVRGGTAVMASAGQRLVAHRGGHWDLLWPALTVGGVRPPAERKYQLVEGPPVAVSNRLTRVVEARQAGRLVERLYLDQETGLLLRRDHFEKATVPDRTVEFESVTIGGTTPAPSVPAQVDDNAPRVVSQPASSGVSAPAVLADGYVRVGLFRKSGVVQAQYSDGLFDLSVFEQDGRLDRDNLPAGQKLSIGRATGWHYQWAGGHVVVWQSSGTVYTAVSDAPLDHVVAVISTLPPVAGSASFITRLRQVCRSLVQPLSD